MNQKWCFVYLLHTTCNLNNPLTGAFIDCDTVTSFISHKETSEGHVNMPVWREILVIFV